MEFAVVAPIFILLLFGMIEYGRMVMVQQMLTNATREGARQAVLDGATTEGVRNTVKNYLSSGGINLQDTAIVIKAEPVDLDPSKGDGATRKVKMEDGILLPRYRLPTEAEWEFAAIGLIGNTTEELITERRL